MNKPKHKPAVDFIHFPYGELDVRIPRRDLVQLVTQQLHIFSQAERASSALKLSDLGLMEFPQLSTLIPFIIPPNKVKVRNDAIWVQEGQQAQTQLCGADEYTSAALELFNGKKSIADIARDLAQTTPLKAVQCDAYVRGLFLTLVSCGICRPANTQV
jgi:hypothetical protein